MNNGPPTGPLPRASTVWANSRDRQIHNVEVDDAVAGQHLCGNLHLPTGMPAARAAPRRMPVHRSAGAIAVVASQPITLGEQSPIKRLDQDRSPRQGMDGQRLPPA